ncbi:MAG: hypothetical protein LPK45_04570 [Bacteroidota bacterium]|nr:hypothetical protein [Bacteroidota bacterium]MDX5430329.1 hypothetical protein [Bacteroidota bacterium]MDX5469090.1 hypothetical protein [Bacteroidota bacterium]
MKKGSKKLNTGPAQVSTFSCGVVYYRSNGENQYPLLESLINANRQYSIVVVTDELDDTLKRWQEQEKAQCCNASTLKETIQNTHADYWLAANKDTLWNIPRSIHGLQIQEEIPLYLPETVKVDGEKPGLGSLFARLYYNKMQSFFYPAPHPQSSWKAFFL